MEVESTMMSLQLNMKLERREGGGSAPCGSNLESLRMEVESTMMSSQLNMKLERREGRGRVVETSGVGLFTESFDV
jgi:hypothetical protein